MPTISLTSTFLLTLNLPCHRHHHHHRTYLYCRLPITCHSSSPDEKPNNLPTLLQLTTTLTVLAASLCTPPAIATAAAAIKVPEMKRPAKKPAEALSPEQLKSWCNDLPLVNNRIPYTEILKLREDGRLKHLVKLPSSHLRQQGDVVLVVLDDSRVLRAALPGMERDERLWAEWERLGLNSVCINAYTPPVKTPETPKPFLGFLAKVPMWMFLFVKKRLEKKSPHCDGFLRDSSV